MTKTFKSRDSATSVLRKLGIKPSDYNLFIDHKGDKFICQTGKAQDYLNSLKAPKAPIVTPVSTEKKVRKASRCVSSVAREMIKDGKTNEQIWAVLKAEFKLDDTKKHYPAWYRNEAKRKAGE